MPLNETVAISKNREEGQIDKTQCRCQCGHADCLEPKPSYLTSVRSKQEIEALKLKRAQQELNVEDSDIFFNCQCINCPEKYLRKYAKSMA